jgi:hypothetical protein
MPADGNSGDGVKGPGGLVETLAAIDGRPRRKSEWLPFGWASLSEFDNRERDEARRMKRRSPSYAKMRKGVYAHRWRVRVNRRERGEAKARRLAQAELERFGKREFGSAKSRGWGPGGRRRSIFNTWHRIVLAMEPGRWMERAEIVRAVQSPAAKRSGTDMTAAGCRLYLRTMVERGLVEKALHPDYDPTWGTQSTDGRRKFDRRRNVILYSTQFVYRLTPDGEQMWGEWWPLT